MTPSTPDARARPGVRAPDGTAGAPAGSTDLGLRALAAAGVATALIDPSPDAPVIVWTNPALTRLTGHAADDLRGRPLEVLCAPEAEVLDVAALRAALCDGSPATWRMLSLRADGVRIWCECTVGEVPAADDEPARWVCTLSDITQQVGAHEEQERFIEVDRVARRTLELISSVSDLLSDLDYPYVLRDVAAHLQRDVVGWAGFFLNDGSPRGLRFADGLQPTPGPHRSSLRPVGAGVDALGDARAPGESVAVDASATTFIDPLQEMLDGLSTDPITFALRPDYPVGSAARSLADAMRARLAPEADGRVPVVVVNAVPGRRRVRGVLVTTPPAASPLTARGSAGPVGRRGTAQLESATTTLLHVVARRVGMAIDNVRLYMREHQLAETLQRAMLPEQAEVPGLDVWTYYAPTSEHAQVGGDWYDVLQIDDGVAGLVIGDVVGHDVEAAATMGQLRSVVRSYAFELTTPGTVLERVDQLVVGMRIPRSASLVYAALRARQVASGMRWTLDYSRAGHLPPLLVRGGEVTQLAGAGGALIGFGARSRSTASEELEPGDTLVFYTDGLIERRDRSLREGLRTLLDAASLVRATDAAGVGEELLARLADAPEDDIAVIVVRVPDPGASSGAAGMSPRSRRWLLPSEPASIGRARHAVVRTCQAWELRDVANAELVVSELVANGVLHGWGHIALRLFDTGEGLRIEVEDSNPSPPVTTDGHANRLGGYGMQIVERLAEWGWRPHGTGKLVWARVRPSVPIGR